MKTSLKKLANFLVAAKKSSWAKGASEELEYGIRKVAPHVSHFETFDLCYIDQYVGGEPFQGFEVISELYPEYRGFWKPIWAMSYGGEYKSTKKEYKEVVNFLREALKAVPIDAPFRGPKQYKSKDYYYVYANCWSGDIKHFEGTEFIYGKPKHPIKYLAKYSGGLVNKREI